jgi:HEPN domain-containing protein
MRVANLMISPRQSTRDALENACGSNAIAVQQLARRRLTEAKTLLDAGHYEGAYYLTGYAVELGFKACVCRLYTHDFDKLVRLAKLEPHRIAWSQMDTVLTALRWEEAMGDLELYLPESASEPARLYVHFT